MMAGMAKDHKRKGTAVEFTALESEVLDLSALVSDGPDDLGYWLMGKLVTRSSFNSRTFMRVMPQVWKMPGRVEVCAVEQNLYTFKFLNSEERDFVLRTSPWTFDRFTIALQVPDVDDNP